MNSAMGTTIKQLMGDEAEETLETRNMNMIWRVILAEYEKIVAQGDPEGQTKS